MFPGRRLNPALTVFYSIVPASSSKSNAECWEKINVLTRRFQEKSLQNHRDKSSENKWLVEEFAFCLLQYSIVLEFEKLETIFLTKTGMRKQETAFLLS